MLSFADGKLATDAVPAHFRQRVGLSAARAYPAKMEPPARRHIILNAFDMFTPSHLCFGQWRRGEDEVADKFGDLSYWTNLAQTLERGDIHALILADTYGQHDVYNGSAEPTIRTSCQFPMGDPVIVSKKCNICTHDHTLTSDVAGDGHGDCNEETWVHCNNQYELRGTIRHCKEVLDSRSSYQRAFWLEHRHFFQGICC